LSKDLSILSLSKGLSPSKDPSILRPSKDLARRVTAHHVQRRRELCGQEPERQLGIASSASLNVF
jgi:hypothetical protein